MQLTEFLSWLRGDRARETAFLKALRARTLLSLFRRFKFVRPADAEDALSETLLDLLAGEVRGFQCTAAIDSEEFSISLIHYLSKFVAPHKLADLHRKSGSKYIVDNVDIESEPVQWSLGLWTEDPLAAQQHTSRLLQCVEVLSDKLRSVMLGVLAQEPHQEIALRLGINSIGTVKSRIFEAMKRLSACLGVSVKPGEQNGHE
jgi:hypothetical protein